MTDRPFEKNRRLRKSFIPSRDERFFSLIEHLSEQIRSVAGKPVLVAFSGGVDSTVLLHLSVGLREQGKIKSLSAVHIHHGLSENADSWAEHCLSLCEQWQVPLEVVRVAIESSSDIERQAREARYAVFEDRLPEDGCLLMGHHQDDQAETVLFRLLRGSGLDGVAGMPASRGLGGGVLLRPLLNISRQTIENYAENYGLGFVEDESNQDQRFRRNFLRQNLMPQIEAVWPGVAVRLAQFSEDVSEVNQMLLEQTEQYARSIIQAPPSRLWGERSVLDLEALKLINGLAARRLVRYWLASHQVQMPDRVRLNALFTDLIEAVEDAEPVVLIGAFQLRRFIGKLVLLRKPEPIEREGFDWQWRADRVIKLPFSGGRLSLEEGGDVRLPETTLRILFRSELPAGLKVAVKGREGRKTIKRWLQDYKVPPWVRESVPFVFHGDQLVALPGFFVTDTYACDPGAGISLSWCPDV
ncbi:tRNA lysidine(34) synthetase TilS [Endozoicomonas sp. 8E]|uniref:tRNA lysidine(34) synthetase TilS n=1 Tax=Endozoicomonas sp. 8E TaxID=3035692 RepID=UPI0029390B72|nr:tRNA lysidine(34) synthetase TilS [Endozoicomonas sp. 8E]WOG25459.1 tRNA lysidine(34) synthetase TilS [Endozoicomonas sp. 8E]